MRPHTVGKNWVPISTLNSALKIRSVASSRPPYWLYGGPGEAVVTETAALQQVSASEFEVLSKVLNLGVAKARRLAQLLSSSC